MCNEVDNHLEEVTLKPTITVVVVSLTLLSGACSVAPARPPVHPADLLAAWNETVLSAAKEEDALLTLKGLRTATMVHIAIHDALNAIEPRYATYLDVDPAPQANPVAAAAQAAFTVSVDQYPDLTAVLRSQLDRWLTRIEESPAKRAGIALGQRTATAVLAARDGDGWNSEADYQWHPMGPGVYVEFKEHSGTPEGFIFGAGWAVAKPFLLDSSSHFRSPPPPAIASDAYTRAFDEVKLVGRFESSARTADQTHLALWWKDYVENSHNRLARQLVLEGDGLELWAAARLFALLNASVYDAYVNVFDNKFLYNHWRPYTAIRWAESDGNPETQPEEAWDNTHRHTYAFPSYPSAHGTACAAAMTVLADTFGDARPFTMTTSAVDRAGPMSEPMALDPPTRSFARFSEAATECTLSRLYLGIHFRYDSLEGNRLGTEIGSYATERFFGRTLASP